MKNIKKKQFQTADGSPTLYMKSFDEYYHSKHGAVQEANHVYLEMGLAYWRSLNPKAQNCHIFEMGFGTGLNAFLTAQKVQEKQVHFNYTTIEAFPLSNDEINEVNYAQFLGDDASSLFDKIIAAPWEVLTPITTNYSLKKIKCLLQEFQPVESIDLLYYDAFGARSQPEVWEDSCFQPLVEKMNPGGVFVTYAAKGSVRRALQNLGLEVALVPGPPGKREMIQAYRPLL
ncbi:MAG: tRNA (5-methylaminomethyl-2-thiouridine)(34)-methyltransferase MnmD [Flavobacteriaceae bacterium]